MHCKWLNKTGNKNLTVFFNGWGMDEKIVSHLDFGGYDIITYSDYRNLDINVPDFSQYDKKVLIAWSMGVMVCNYFYEIFKDFDKFIAINGTPKAIDDEYGIPKVIYNLTAENFNENSSIKFMKKITPKIELHNYCSRNTEELQKELLCIKEINPEKYFKFDKAYVSLKDRIIPAKNQMKYWSENKTPVTELDLPHYILDEFKSWDEII